MEFDKIADLLKEIRDLLVDIDDKLSNIQDSCDDINGNVLDLKGYGPYDLQEIGQSVREIENRLTIHID